MADGVTRTKERADRGSGTGVGDPWHVIVLNDDHNTFDGVAAALSAVLPNVSFGQGLQLANRVHNAGQAIVWSGHREVAEHYRRGLERRGLTMAPLDR